MTAGAICRACYKGLVICSGLRECRLADELAERNVAEQQRQPNSLLQLYRALIELRRDKHLSLAGGIIEPADRATTFWCTNASLTTTCC